MHVVLLHNEKAGDEDWSRKRLVKLVRSAGFEPRYCTFKEALAEPRLLEKGEFVIAAGGDGSIRKAALTLLDRGRPLAPLPLGTANNIARSLGLPQNVEAVVAGWSKPRKIPMDIGEVTGPWGRRTFIEGIGLGLISRAIEVLTFIDDVSAVTLKKAKHRLYRDACVATALAHEMQPFTAKLEIDGKDASGDFLMLEILNIRRAGPGLELAPHANPSDGRFDIVALTAQQRRRLTSALNDRLAGEGPTHSLATRRASRIRLRPSADCELRIDDGTLRLAAGKTLDVTIRPGALEFVLPRQ